MLPAGGGGYSASQGRGERAAAALRISTDTPGADAMGDEALRAALKSADANSNGEVSIIEAIKALRA